HRAVRSPSRAAPAPKRPGHRTGLARRVARCGGRRRWRRPPPPDRDPHHELHRVLPPPLALPPGRRACPVGGASTRFGTALVGGGGDGRGALFARDGGGRRLPT